MPRKGPLRRIGLAAAGLVLGLAGCLFDPRDPEEGGGEACFVAVAAETPGQVIENLDGSMECLQSADYMRQISPEFVFIPSASVQADYPELFASGVVWGQEQENEFIDTLSGDVDSSLLLREIERSGTSEVLIEAEYRVTVAAEGSEIEYTGEAFYTFRQEQTVWVMVRWEEKEAASPFGAFKAALVSGR